MRKLFTSRFTHRSLALTCALCISGVMPSGYAKPTPAQFKIEDQTKFLSQLKRQHPCSAPEANCVTGQHKRPFTPAQDKAPQRN